MSSTELTRASRRWLATEVVQTSPMDCGPAVLKCLLEGFGIPVSYGRLREACQTDVDGTSIDTIELVANQLGVAAEQMVLPVDHLFLPGVDVLPAVLVVRHGNGATHFVVVWRRYGRWLQVMDPSIGRRWVSCDTFAQEIFRHRHGVAEPEWRAWAATDDFQRPLRRRLSLLGTPDAVSSALIKRASGDAGWFTFGALDAAVRLVQSVIEADGIEPGTEAVKLLGTLFDRTCTSTSDIHTLLPADYWSVAPDLENPDARGHRLLLQGAVLLRLRGPSRDVGSRRPGGGAAQDARAAADVAQRGAAALSPELAAALKDKTPHPMRAVWDLLKSDGILAPMALLGAMLIAVGAVLVETLLFRGIFDIAWMLNQASQRIGAVLALISFVAVLLVIEWPINMETMRLGRYLETRMRMALLRKLPHLSDRYFQSRPVSDMAQRSHAIQMMRNVPALGLRFVQTLWEMLLTFVGIVLIDPASALVALALALLPIVLSLAVQPMINERDLRVRNHASALDVFYLDSLLGLVPIRTHRAEKVVSRQHEGLLTEWARSSIGLLRMNLLSNGLLALACMGLAGYLLVSHFLRTGVVAGGDLLLVYWALKLPAIGSALASLAQQYPGQRNVLLRLLEPLSTPEEAALAQGGTVPEPEALAALPGSRPDPIGAIAITIKDGSVIAAGHTILRDVGLRIAPGEHVAIVGKSGAGKSTLIGLLLGWHRLASGELLLDGRRLGMPELEALRRAIAWVDPGVQIWNQSFLDNLAYASADDGLPRIGEVIEAATLHEVLRKLPQGLQTCLGEGGGLVSGGEGQRVRLARALLQTGVRMALLDEPFRGMDRVQRKALLAEARAWWKDVTLLCVTHDVSETLPFGRVLVVENGRIVEDGVPAQLAAGQSRYRELLEAETLVRERMWAGQQWRHLRLHDGRLQIPS